MGEHDLSHVVEVDFILDDLHWDAELTLDELNEILAPFIDKALKTVEKTVERTGLPMDAFEMVLLAGGSSQLPGLAESISRLLRGSERPVVFPNHVMQAVSRGAAVFHSQLLELPGARPERPVLGNLLGTLTHDGGRLTVQPVLQPEAQLPESGTVSLYPKGETVDIRLYWGPSVEPRECIELRSRVLRLSKMPQQVLVTVAVDENRMIRLDAEEPVTGQNISFEVEPDQISEDMVQQLRDAYGIEVDVQGSPVPDSVHPAVGIDLGTTTSEVAWASKADFRCFNEGRAQEAIRDCVNTSGPPREECAELVFPSIVSFSRDGELHVADRTAWNDKDDTALVADGRVFTAFKIADRSRPVGMVDGREVTVKQLSAQLLKRLWQASHQSVPQASALQQAVITVPAAFSPDQYADTHQAARLAGIENPFLLDEPSAAFWYYQSLNPEIFENEQFTRVLVFDWGGGTADVAILDVSRFSAARRRNERAPLNVGEHGRLSPFEVRMVGGDHSLIGEYIGGEYIDRAIAAHFRRKFEAETGRSLDGKYTALSKLMKAAREAKVAVSKLAQEAGLECQ